MSFEQIVEQAKERAKAVNDSGDTMTEAVTEIRRFARRVRLIEMRVTSEEVQDTSRSMRELVETMIVDVGSQGGERFGSIRASTFANAFDTFIDAGNRVLNDVEPDEPGSESRRRLLVASRNMGKPRSRRRWNDG